MSSLERVASRVLWLWRFAKGWLPQALATATGVISIIWASYGVKIWSDGLWALIVAIVTAVGSVVAQFALQKPSYMELARQKEEAEAASEAKSEAIKKSLDVLARHLASHCKAASNSDRVSVYYCHGDQFVLVARYSMHPVYNERGRRSYPLVQGALGDAWNRGFAITNLPVTRKAWNKSLESSHGFDAELAASLKMHCLDIVALRIDVDYHPVGVVVFESTERGRVTQTTLDTAKSSMLYQALSELVNAVATLTAPVEAFVKAAAAREVPPAPDWKEAPKAPSAIFEKTN